MATTSTTTLPIGLSLHNLSGDDGRVAAAGDGEGEFEVLAMLVASGCEGRRIDAEPQRPARALYFQRADAAKAFRRYVAGGDYFALD